MKVAAHVGLTWAWRRRASVSDLGGERGGAASSGGRARALDRWSTPKLKSHATRAVRINVNRALGYPPARASRVSTPATSVGMRAGSQASRAAP